MFDRVNSSILLALISMFGIITPTLANDARCADINNILDLPRFSSLNNEQRNEAIISANWSESKRLVAFCYDKSCYIAKVCNDSPAIVDISGVVLGNLGKIGWKPEYDKIENRPLLTSENENEVLARWVNDESIISKERDEIDTYGSYIRTRIWKDGQRYTVYEPMLIRNDRPMYR